MIADQRSSRRAISLLEVVLALAILAMASAYLAQSMHIAAENATRAERMTQAEIIAESVMNQVVAGVLPIQSASWTAYSSANPMGATAALNKQSQWMYSISQLSTEVPGMIGIQVAVDEVGPNGADGQADFYINCWIIDPNLGLDTPPEESTDTAGTSTSASSAGSSTTGGLQ